MLHKTSQCLMTLWSSSLESNLFYGAAQEYCAAPTFPSVPCQRSLFVIIFKIYLLLGNQYF